MKEVHLIQIKRDHAGCLSLAKRFIILKPAKVVIVPGVCNKVRGLESAVEILYKNLCLTYDISSQQEMQNSENTDELKQYMQYLNNYKHSHIIF